MFKGWNGPAKHDECFEEEEDELEGATGEGQRLLQPVYAEPPPKGAKDLNLLQKAFPKRNFGWELLLGSWDRCVSDLPSQHHSCDSRSLPQAALLLNIEHC
jgi:hypothetical protein